MTCPRPPLWSTSLSMANRTKRWARPPTDAATTPPSARLTGKPVWPIVEKPVPQSDVPGEKTSKTQPFASKPAPYARQAITDADLIDFTPDMKKEAQDLVKAHWKMSPMFGPAVVSN